MTPELIQEQNSVESAPSNAAESHRVSPGALIRRARERARLTPEELSAQLKLARGTLEALERDDFKVLVEPVYVRGYYRKCAKLLGIAEKDLVDAYEAQVAPRAPVAPSKLRLASGTELGSGSRLPVALAFLAAAVAVVVCAFIWFARGETNRVPPAVAAKVEAMTPEEDKTAAAAPAAAVPAAAAPAGAASAASPTPATPAPVEDAAPHAVPAAVPAAPAAANAGAPAATVAPAPAPARAAAATNPAPAAAKPAVAATPSKLLLNFTITSWARVDDAGGKTLLNGLVRAGDKQELQGGGPFTVFLGNAPGVNLQLNGKPVDLTPYMAENKTARFTLTP
ncbi:MAG: helix-turn-helix domain-containing protein [Nevskiaceae bacterium]|nr:MAG: helix-turn-helix domain-containing protein [Nevskiaceae bacterium]